MSLATVPPDYLDQDIQSGIDEARRLRFGNYRPITVPLRGILSSGTTSAENTYTVPRGFNFLVRLVRGHVSFNALTSEELTAAVANQVALHRVAGVLGRAAVKAMTVTLRLVNEDRGDLKFFGREGTDSAGNQILPRLSSIYPPAGGRPIRLRRFPYVAMGGDNLKLTVATTDGTAMGQATECGVILIGELVSNRVDAVA